MTHSPLRFSWFSLGILIALIIAAAHALRAGIAHADYQLCLGAFIDASGKALPAKSSLAAFAFKDQINMIARIFGAEQILVFCLWLLPFIPLLFVGLFVRTLWPKWALYCAFTILAAITIFYLGLTFNDTLHKCDRNGLAGSIILDPIYLGILSLGAMALIFGMMTCDWFFYRKLRRLYHTASGPT